MLFRSLTRWKVRSQAIVGLMLSYTLAAFGLAMLAWRLAVPGGHDFWTELHSTYWRLYIIAGALWVPLGAYLVRED